MNPTNFVRYLSRGLIDRLHDYTATAADWSYLEACAKEQGVNVKAVIADIDRKVKR